MAVTPTPTPTPEKKSAPLDPAALLADLLALLTEFKAADLTSPAFWTLVLTTLSAMVVAVLVSMGVGVPGGATGAWVQLGVAVGAFAIAAIAGVFLHKNVVTARANRLALATSVLQHHASVTQSQYKAQTQVDR